MELPPRKNIAWNWIAGREFDLLWINGAALFGFVYLFLVFGLRLPALLVFWCWTCFFDRPHLIPTYLRTYFDKQERKENLPLLVGSLTWLMLGPLVVMICAGLNSQVPWVLYFFFVILSGWWHVLRQHYGFLVQYQKRGNESFGVSNRSEFYLYHTLMIGPFFAVLLKSDAMKATLGLSQFLPAYYSDSLGTAIGFISLSAFVLLIAKSLVPLFKGSPANATKVLFIFASSVLPVFLCFSPYTRHIDYWTLVGAVTVFHNIQYTAFVWHYGQGKYQSTNHTVGDRTFGFAHFCTRNLVVFLSVTLIVGIGLRFFDWSLTGDSRMNYFHLPRLFYHALHRIQLGGRYPLEQAALGVFNGIALHHYYLDSKIWRVRKDFKLT